MSLTQQELTKFYLSKPCQIHYDYCSPPYETRKSIFGAIVTGCMDAWTKPLLICEHPEKKIGPVDLELWKEVINA